MSVVAAPPASEIAARPSTAARTRLEFLDGLRGLAALWVVFHHCWMQICGDRQSSVAPWLRLCTQWMAYGHFAVAVFIVLSGFCLMLPVARSADGQIKGGLRGYFYRRARRILPPYYAALFLSLALIAITPGLQRPSGVQWDTALSAFTPGAILSHLLLVHNFSKEWVWKINGPMWSVATEWQIYFVFALCLLPLWRRCGMTVTLLAALICSAGPYYLGFEHFQRACPWYLGLFAMGMAGALCAFSPQPSLVSWRRRVPWSLATLLLWAAIPAFWFLAARRLPHSDVSLDILFGAATACLLVYCAGALTERRFDAHPLVLRLLEAPWAVRLGVFSYSLYLTHYPLVALAHLPLRAMHLNDTTRLLVLPALATPLCLGVAYLFHLAFERRFMSLPAQERNAAKAPAP